MLTFPQLFCKLLFFHNLFTTLVVEELLKVAVIEIEYEDGLCVIKITRCRPTSFNPSESKPPGLHCNYL